MVIDAMPIKSVLLNRVMTSPMHREDLAAFMVAQLTDNAWVRKCVAIGH